MNQIKNILICLLVLAILPISAASAESLTESRDVGFLNAIGILAPNSDEKLLTEDTVTRGEFAQMVSKILCGGECEMGGTVFTDVDADLARSISAAVSCKVMSGYSDGTFRPETGMRFEEAVKAVVCLLGYEATAENKGGYPNGYISVANSLGLLRGVNGKSGDFASWRDTAKILREALEEPLLTLKSLSGDTIKYDYDKNKTMLTEYMNIFSVKEQIRGASGVMLDGSRDLGADIAVVGDVEYVSGDFEVRNFLGYRGTVYYKMSDDDVYGTIVWIETGSNDNEVLQIDAEDIRDFRLDNKRNLIIDCFDSDSGRNETVMVSCTADVLYNGRAADEQNWERIFPNTGCLKLIDNGCDGEYDVIFIENYQIYVADQISVLMEWVTDYYSGEKLELADSLKKTVEIYSDGKKTDISAISKWDVLTVYASNEGSRELVRVFVSRKTVQGTISAKSEDEITIADRSYELEKSLQTAVENGQEELLVGEEKKYCLSDGGKIAAVVTSDPIGQYGYLLKTETEKGLSQNAKLRIFDLDTAKWQTFTCTDKVRLDHKKVRSLDDILSLKRVLMRYRVDSEGVVTDLYTPEESYSGKRTLFYNDMVNSCVEENGGGVSYFVGGSTVFLTVPDDAHWQEEDYYYRGISPNARTNYPMQVYDATNYVGRVIVYEDTKASAADASSNTSIFVKSVRTVCDKNGAEVYKIEGIRGGQNISFSLKDTVMEKSHTLSLLSCGDVIRCDFDTSGAAMTLSHDFIEETRKVQDTAGSCYGNPFIYKYIVYGKLLMVDVTRGVLAIEYADADGNQKIHTVKMPSEVVICYEDRDKLEVGTQQDLCEGQMALFLARGGYPEAIEIFVPKN